MNIGSLSVFVGFIGALATGWRILASPFMVGKVTKRRRIAYYSTLVIAIILGAISLMG